MASSTCAGASEEYRKGPIRALSPIHAIICASGRGILLQEGAPRDQVDLRMIRCCARTVQMRFLHLANSMCWVGLLLNMIKSVLSAIPSATGLSVETNAIKLNGAKSAVLPRDQAYEYVGVQII
uniref:Uncharacterized protein n=1 Tax=Cryptomonas curvata TaxID=233186 RepID=A0A7S0MIH7_9CRYP|mmetsp:Transcript_41453/g.86627  ORF Transcript_41453/g.86627 Transcript_41453/m.86627 type:complete len:124 (+) Transcript_41453:602-973(+)